MKRTLSRFALGIVAAGALFAVACGGDDGGSSGGGDSTKDPVKFAETYYLTAFRVFTGATTADDMMKLFEDSCRSKVTAADVGKGMDRSRDVFPKLKGAKVEAIDFQGKAKVEKTDKGAKVTIPGPADARVKVDGKFQNAFEYFKSVGLAEDEDKNQTDEIELVLANGLSLIHI